MSAGGNVPTQGVAVQAATTEKKRGSRSMGKPTGYTFGKGSASKRLKSLWRKSKPGSPFKEFVKGLSKVRPATSDQTIHEDAKTWLSRKRPGGDDKQRAARKEKKERIAALRYAESRTTSVGKKK